MEEMIKVTLTLIVASQLGDEIVYGKQLVLPICPRSGDYVMLTDQVSAMCTDVMLQEDFFPIINLLFIDDEEETMQFLDKQQFDEVRHHLIEHGWAIIDEEVPKEALKKSKVH